MLLRICSQNCDLNHILARQIMPERPFAPTWPAEYRSYCASAICQVYARSAFAARSNGLIGNIESQNLVAQFSLAKDASIHGLLPLISST
jgi:hypothetical protein